MKKIGLNFPVIIQPNLAVSNLFKSAHDLFVCKNEKALRELIENDLHEVSTWCPLIVQKMVQNAD
jgi:hypothetical protein